MELLIPLSFIWIRATFPSRDNGPFLGRAQPCRDLIIEIFFRRERRSSTCPFLGMAMYPFPPAPVLTGYYSSSSVVEADLLVRCMDPDPALNPDPSIIK
jgi:hypothetical protein